MPDTTLLDGLHARVEGAAGRSMFEAGDPRVLAWMKEAVREGERFNSADPAFGRMDSMMEYIIGNQLPPDRPTYLPNVIVNQTKKSVKAHVSALTDLKAVFAYKTYNDHWKPHAELLTKLVVVWYINTFADLEIGDAAKIALTTGCSDVLVEYDPSFGRHGDNRLIPRDARDTLPIRPSRDRSIQSWEGAIFREAHSPNAMKGRYPDKAHLFEPDRSGLWGQIYTRFQRLRSLVTPTNLDIAMGAPHSGPSAASAPEINLYKGFFHDRSINLSSEPKVMGTPGTSWAYLVAPGAPLYPRRRCVVCTEKVVLYDGPNPHWHGMIPMSRLKLDPWPWLFFGLGQCHDLQPLQDGLNQIVNDLFSTFSQWVNRGAIADKNAVPESLFKRFDPRRKNWKMKLNPTYGEGFKLVDGPNLPPWTMEFVQLLFSKYDEHSGVANLQALMQLRQMPGADTIEKYWEALTPELRLEGRYLEAFLRDIAEMLKCNVFQYYSTERRVQMLGDPGVLLEDFDYDPGSLVPAMRPGDEGYVESLDASKSRDERAQHFMKNFTFYVAPNSMLSLNSTERKMIYIQGARQGYIDVVTLAEQLEIPNMGQYPPMPLPPLRPIPQEEQAAILIGGAPLPPNHSIDPMTGQILEMRIPATIIERLMAQQQLGIGQTVSPAGRKASGEQPPQLQRKSDASGNERITISESG